MEITTTEYKRCIVVKSVGRIDSYTAPKLEEALSSVTKNGNYKIVLDMEEVDLSSNIRFALRYSAAVQFVFGAEIVTYGITNTAN